MKSTVILKKHYWKVLWYLKTLLLTIIFLFHWDKNRDGERINLCNYAHCLETDCICKSLSENLSWDVQTSRTSKVTLQLRRGFYHDRYRDIAKVFFLIHLSIDRHIHIRPHTQTHVRLCLLYLSFLSKFYHLGFFVCLTLLLAVIPDLFKQDFSPHLVIAPNAGIAAYSSWLPTIVCLSHSKNLSLTVCIYLAVLANLTRSCYLYQWTENRINLIYFFFSLNPSGCLDEHFRS